jgi:hypothetical protein
LISEPKLPVEQFAGPERAEIQPNTPISSDSATSPNGHMQLWLRRIWVLLFVFVCATTGVLLLILPWRPEWTDNSLLFTFPALRAVMASGFVRGVCTGLGVLDIWIGFSEAIHYHEDKHE